MLTQEDLQALKAIIRIESQILRDDTNRAIKQLDKKVETLDLKIEASLAFSKKAHTEIMETLVEANEISGHQIKDHKKRIERLEEHTGLAKPS